MPKKKEVNKTFRVEIHYSTGTFKYDIYESVACAESLQDFMEVYKALLAGRKETIGKNNYTQVAEELNIPETRCDKFIMFFSNGKKAYTDNKRVGMKNDIEVDKIINIIIDGKSIMENFLSKTIGRVSIPTEYLGHLDSRLGNLTAMIKEKQTTVDAEKNARKKEGLEV